MTKNPHPFSSMRSVPAMCKLNSLGALVAFGVMLTPMGHAQTAAPAPPPAAATNGAAPARARGPAAPATLLPLEPWKRPADGPAVFTEDFETGAINDKVWTVHATGTATVAAQQDMAAHGKNALKITYPAGAARSLGFVTAKVPEALREHFYGRAYMYISGVPDPHSVFVLSGSAGYPGSANWLEIGGYQGHFQPSLQITAATPDKPRGEVPLFQGTLPLGRWFCMEWEFIDKPDRIVVWVDGELAVNAPFTYAKIVNPEVSKDSGLIGGFVEFSLGYRTFAPGTAITKDLTIYYDDIAIGDKPIGRLSPVMAK